MSAEPKFDGSSISDDALERITKSVPKAHILGVKPNAPAGMVTKENGVLFYVSTQTGRKYKISNLVHQYELLLTSNAEMTEQLIDARKELEAFKAKEKDDEDEGQEEQAGKKEPEEQAGGKSPHTAERADGKSILK